MKKTPNPRNRALGFPPTRGKSVSARLAKAIESSPLSFFAIAEGARVPRQSVSRFMSGERSLSQHSIDVLAEFLGMELLAKKSRRPEDSNDTPETSEP